MLIIDGVRYEQGDYSLEISSGLGSGMEIRARTLGGQSFITEPVNQCEHCHRADWQQVVCRSIEEAVARGWLVAVDEPGPAADRLPRLMFRLEESVADARAARDCHPRPPQEPAP